MHKLISSSQSPQVLSALIGIERSNLKEGNTVLHMAIDT